MRSMPRIFLGNSVKHVHRDLESWMLTNHDFFAACTIAQTSYLKQHLKVGDLADKLNIDTGVSSNVRNFRLRN